MAKSLDEAAAAAGLFLRPRNAPVHRRNRRMVLWSIGVVVAGAIAAMAWCWRRG